MQPWPLVLLISGGENTVENLEKQVNNSGKPIRFLQWATSNRRFDGMNPRSALDNPEKTTFFPEKLIVFLE
jgi:hypothetical protein